MFNTNQALVQLRVELDGRSDIVWSNPMVNSPYACIPLRYFVNDFLTTKLLRGLRDYFFYPMDDLSISILISKTSMFPICLFWSANFIFGNPKEANWNTKSEIGNIEVLDIRPKR